MSTKWQVLYNSMHWYTDIPPLLSTPQRSTIASWQQSNPVPKKHKRYRHRIQTSGGLDLSHTTHHIQWRRWWGRVVAYCTRWRRRTQSDTSGCNSANFGGCLLRESLVILVFLVFTLFPLPLLCCFCSRHTYTYTDSIFSTCSITFSSCSLSRVRCQDVPRMHDRVVRGVSWQYGEQDFDGAYPGRGTVVALVSVSASVKGT